MGNYVEKSWSDDTIGKSLIERLDFPAEAWTKLEVLISGHKDKNTGVSTQYTADGNKIGDHWDVLVGTDQRSYVYNFDGQKKIALLVSGYITNHILFLGGGATVRARAYK